MKTDLAMVRQMAQAIGGRGFGGRINAWDESQKDLLAHVGKDAGQEFSAWYNSAEAKAFRDKELPEVYRKAKAYDELVKQGSQVATPDQVLGGQIVELIRKVK